MNKSSFEPKTLVNKLSLWAARLKQYSFIAFIVFIGLLYGFIAYRTSSLSHAEPSDADVTSQVKTAQIPHIDKTVIKQLQSLQDNSVSVHALFDQARSNPFQ